jgi:hypothetical protein
MPEGRIAAIRAGTSNRLAIWRKSTVATASFARMLLDGLAAFPGRFPALPEPDATGRDGSGPSAAPHARHRGALRLEAGSRYDPEPERRLLELLKAQGLQSNQAITFLSDGGETVRELPRGLIPQAEYLLDWFHVTMRLTGMSRMAQGVRAEGYPDLSADLEDMLEHLKWNLWHGKVDRALEITDELAYALDIEGGSLEHRKLLEAVRAFETYLTNNRAFIPNYGERYRKGQIISTAFVESAVNQLVSKRFVKKQQMRWTLAGAHLLQIRAQVLNEDWRATLGRWYPGMQATAQLNAA